MWNKFYLQINVHSQQINEKYILILKLTYVMTNCLSFLGLRYEENFWNFTNMIVLFSKFSGLLIVHRVHPEKQALVLGYPLRNILLWKGELHEQKKFWCLEVFDVRVQRRNYISVAIFDDKVLRVMNQ